MELVKTSLSKIEMLRFWRAPFSYSLILLFSIFCGFAAKASCPSGYVEVDVGNLYTFSDTDTCPSGYVAIDTSLKLPSLSDTCDPSKGTCIGSCTYTP